MKFEWNESYSVGVEEIDKQHKRFFELANEAYDVANNPSVALDDLLIVVSKLNDYAFYHLGTEEEYFKKFDYEDADMHTRMHNVYRNQMQKYLEEIRSSDNNRRELAEEIALYSGNWLGSHIFVMDKGYMKCFREHGLR